MRKYIEQGVVFSQKKQIKVRSKETGDIRIEIHCYAYDGEDREKIKKEIQKEIRKMSRLLKVKIGYELTIISR